MALIAIQDPMYNGALRAYDEPTCAVCGDPASTRGGVHRECSVLDYRRDAVAKLLAVVANEPGLRRPALAERLCVSERTVETYIGWSRDPNYWPAAVMLRPPFSVRRMRGYRLTAEESEA